MDKAMEKTLPEMSQAGFEDVVSILLGVPPEGEGGVIYEEEDKRSEDS